MPQSRIRLREPGDEIVAAFDAARARSEIPVEFPADVLAEAERAADWRSGPTGDLARDDFTGIEFVTIDPPGATDLDQALFIEQRDDGFTVFYAIADLAAFVVPGGALDIEVNRRGETIYCPDRRVSLHPPVLSEDAASLLPDQERPAIVWRMDLDSTGTLTSVDVRRGLVRSRRQMTYEQAQAELDRGSNPLIALLAQVGTARAALERERGGVSLERPEQEANLGPDGYELTYREELPVEAHNAQISLLTGITAAILMERAGIGILRTMPPAARGDIQRLRHQARAIGIDWPKSASYGEVLAGLDMTKPASIAFTVAATRLFRGARWQEFTGDVPADSMHAAVAAHYAHVTAPLRRLVDRYGQEVALAVSAGTDVPGWVRDGLTGLGERMTTLAKRAAAVDRQCISIVEAAVLAGHVGESFDAVGLDERTIQLQTPAVEAPCRGHVAAGERLRATLLEATIATGNVAFVAP